MFCQRVDVSCRVLANYLLWRLVLGLVPEMTARYQKERNEYRRVLQVLATSFIASTEGRLKEMRTGWAQTCVIQSPNTIPNVPKP